VAVYIIVVGGGPIGYYLSKTLLDDGHEVLLLEKDGKRREAIAEELGTSIVIRGDGCEATTLEEVGTGRADMLIAVTGDDEDNLVACQVAKHKFNVPRTIAKIKNPRNETLFNKLGIDVTVSSTGLILAHIEHELPFHPLIPLLKLKGGELEMVEIRIPADSIAVGKEPRELMLPKKSSITLIISEERGPQIPSWGTVLKAGDSVIAVTPPETEEALRLMLTASEGRE
jgi:trk system potassium uptake protein TrkA